MNLSLSERSIECPFCGEHLIVLVDSSEGSQTYVEDCQVCCQPIQFTLLVDAAEQTSLQVDCAS